MRLTRRLAIGIALVCGGLAALLSVVYLQGLQRERTAPPPEKVLKEVVVPRATIPPNTLITADMLTAKTVEGDQAPKLAVTSVQSIVGYVAVEPLVAQKPISRSQVLRRDTAFGFAGTVPEGMRAVTVAVDPIMGVAGLLKPRDHVDVIGTFEVGEAILAKTVLQNVMLLALGGQTSGPAPEEREPATEATAAKPAEKKKEPEKKTRKSQATEYPNATLAVTPEDAQKLILADQRGNLRLTLRPVGEEDFVPVPVQDIAGVVGPEYLRLAQAGRAREEAPAKEAAAEQPQPPWAAWGAGPPEKEPKEKEEKPKPPEVEIIRRDQSTTVVP